MADLVTMQNPPEFTAPSYGEVIVMNGTEFQVGDPIGSGGFGHVYECTDEWSNRLVAKVLSPNGKYYAEVRDNWEREFVNLDALRHPGITYIHAAFEYNGAFYLIVERCEDTVEKLLTDKNVTGEIWLPYFARDVLHAVHHIHQRDYVHKDLHAGNVFISHAVDKMVPAKDPVWSFKIGDLGISRLRNEISQVGTVMATWMLPLEYYDPQQYGPLDHRVDVYHVAILLLGMLLRGVPQFTEQEILTSRPRQIAESLRSPYSFALSRALRRHVADRTPNAIEFWRDIARSMPSK